MKRKRKREKYFFQDRLGGYVLIFRHFYTAIKWKIIKSKLKNISAIMDLQKL